MVFRKRSRAATKALASVSLDADNLWCYLRVRADPDWENYPSYLPTLKTRLLDVFERHGMKSTVFMVGKDVEREDGAHMVSDLVAAGHEVANHSLDHEPWLHLYERSQLEEQLDRTDAAVVAAGAPRPTGFRGPGFSLSPDLLQLLSERNYSYDATTLPTWIGPLARAYYLRTASVDQKQREDRAALFGSWKDAFAPVKPYRWDLDGGPDASGLVELPVTTAPFVRVPMHASYVLYIATYSRVLARRYVDTTLNLCRVSGTEPSLLLHPLDLMGEADAPALKFFPGMGLELTEKLAMVDWLLKRFARDFDLVGTGEYVARRAPALLRERASHSIPQPEAG